MSLGEGGNGFGSSSASSNTSRDIEIITQGWGGVGWKETKSLVSWPAADRLWPRWRTMLLSRGSC